MADTKLVKMLYGLLAVSMLLGIVQSRDNTVCRENQYQPGTNEPTKPTLPDTYNVGVECNMQNRHYTADYKEFYDRASQRAALHITQTGFRTQEIYSFATNELFSIDDTSKVCKKQNLTSASDTFLFGAKSANGNAHIYSAYGALHFGQNTSEKWIGNKSIRGVACNQWTSCQYWASRNATMVVDWYFSTADWHTTEQRKQAPVRVHVKGNIWSSAASRPFEHTYEFYDFQSNVNKPTVFETPSGVYCPGRKVTKQIPTPPSAFHFTSELLKPDQHLISRIKEWYNSDMDLVRYEYQPFNNADPYGKDPQMQIHDFNTGIAYIIDQSRGNCTVTSIQNTGFDTRNLDATHVRIRTSKEFFALDKTKYTYEGTKSARGILCDVWITQRTDWPRANSGVTSIWQWFFASPNYNNNFPDKPQFGMPIMLTVDGGGYGYYTYNIYGYDELRPEVFDYDVSKCYNYTAKKDFRIYLPGSYMDLASTNLDALKYGVVAALQTTIPGLSVLRINNLQIDYTDQNDIIVKFTLLDKAPVPGDVANPKPQVDLATAMATITKAINSGAFTVKFKAKSTATAIVMVAKNYINVGDHVRYTTTYVNKTLPDTSTSAGYTGGAMAGLGVAMLVVFFLMGVAAMYIYYRRLGGAFLPKKFENTDITQDTS